MVSALGACGEDIPTPAAVDRGSGEAALVDVGMSSPDVARLDHSGSLDVSPPDVAPTDSYSPDASPADSSPADAASPDASPPDGPPALSRYRRALPLLAGVGAGKGYQVEVRIGQSAQAAGAHLHLFGRARADFGDVRFTAADGITKLPHWLESISGATPKRTAVYRVKVAASLNTNQQIYVYYGEASAKSASQAATTFDFHDGMETPFSTGSTALANAATYLKQTPTYDGSGQAIHPDVLHFPKGWNGYTHWMAMTPYPGGKDPWENPSLLASNDGKTWVAPVGLKAPLAPAPPCDHNSDTDLVYNSTTDELWIYWLDTRRASRCAAHKAKPYYNHNYLRRVTVRHDGKKWVVGTPSISLDQDLGKEALLLSPSVVRLGSTKYQLWMSNGSTKVYRYESTDGHTWGKAQQVTLADKVWHLNVDHVSPKGEYWMLSVYPSSGGALRWATSKDGLSWTSYPAPVMQSRPGKWDANLYRGAFIYDSVKDKLRLWYSAYATGPTVWHTALLEQTYATFVSKLALGTTGGWTVYQQGGSWGSSKAQVKRGISSGRLVQSSGSSSGKMIVYRKLPQSSGFVLEWDLYDDLDPSAFKLVRIGGGVISQQTGVGVWTGASKTHYAYHNNKYGYTVSKVPRTKGWHKLGLRSTGALVEYFVDGVKLGSLAGQVPAAKYVSVEGYHGGLTEFYVDDIRVRRAAVKEPTPGKPGVEQTGSWNVW